VNTPDARGAEAEAAAGVRAACWRLLQETRRLGCQALLVGSGLWLLVGACTETFVVDFAEALERRIPRAEGAYGLRRGGQGIGAVQGGLIRAARWCEPRLGAWRRQAARIDAALLGVRLG